MVQPFPELTVFVESVLICNFSLHACEAVLLGLENSPASRFPLLVSMLISVWCPGCSTQLGLVALRTGQGVACVFWGCSRQILIQPLNTLEGFWTRIEFVIPPCDWRASTDAGKVLHVYFWVLFSKSGGRIYLSLLCSLIGVYELCVKHARGVCYVRAVIHTPAERR